MRRRTNAVITAGIACALAISLAAPAYASDAAPDPIEGDALAAITAEAIEAHYGEAQADPVQAEVASEVEVSPQGTSGEEIDVVLPSTPAADLEGDESSAAPIFYTDATGDGVRIISTFPSKEDVVDLAYEIGGVLDPYLVQVGDSFKVLDANDQYVVDLAAPWAIDASGRYLPTSYTLAGNELRQHIDYTDAIFPVVADPAWTYAVDHASFNLITGKEKATPARVMAELRRCFNCSFPVANAPRAFPSVGQTINLNASPFTMINVAAPVRVSAVVKDGFNFVALPGHFDGADSTISFRFYNDRSGWLHISVAALIWKDRGALANEANRSVASQTWANFLANLIRQRTL
jgi:hypothetical protein